MKYKPKRIVVQDNLENTKIVQKIISRVPSAKVIIDKNNEYRQDLKETTLILKNNPGVYFKPCPQTPEYVCCNYQILNFATGCPINCTYCILNGYFKSRELTFFCDHDRMFEELDNVLEKTKGFMRIGSGEFTDSLVLDHLTDFTKSVIPYFIEKPNVLFEIKSKTVNIENILKFSPNKKVMVSWSMNPQIIQDFEEKGSASLQERLEAAKKCVEKGYLVGFHFDPIIKHDNWEKNYQDVIDAIYSTVQPSDIGWISVGCFRFVPSLKGVIERMYPQTKIIYEEFVLGKDGKMRYFRPIREYIYNIIVERIKKHHKNPPVYFCMESPGVWQTVMNQNNYTSDNLCNFLDCANKR